MGHGADLLHSFWVGDGEIVADHLRLHTAGERRPGGPIILVEGIFDGYDWILGDHILVNISELI